MAMINDENTAPSQANANSSLAAGKRADAVADLKGLFSRRGSKRPVVDVTEEPKNNDDNRAEADHIGPVPKRAKIETWWHGAASVVSTVRSSVSGRAAEKFSQVCSKLHNLPDWIRSRTNAASIVFKAAAAPREIAQSACARIRESQEEAEETEQLCEKDDAIATSSSIIDGDSLSKPLENIPNMKNETALLDVCVNLDEEDIPVRTVDGHKVTTIGDSIMHDHKGITIDDSCPISDEMQGEHMIGDMPSEEDITKAVATTNSDDLIAQTVELQDEPTTFGVQSWEAAVLEVPASEDDIEGMFSNQEAGVLESVFDNEEVVQADELFHEEQHVIQQDTLEVEMMPNDHVDTLPFANEAGQAQDAGFASNQASDLDYNVVDSQGAQWLPVYDDASGCMYYWNQATGETTWTQPTASVEAPFDA